MLVALFNAVKVESVPLNFNFFPRAAHLLTGKMGEMMQPPRLRRGHGSRPSWCVVITAGCHDRLHEQVVGHCRDSHGGHRRRAVGRISAERRRRAASNMAGTRTTSPALRQLICAELRTRRPVQHDVNCVKHVRSAVGWISRSSRSTSTAVSPQLSSRTMGRARRHQIRPRARRLEMVRTVNSYATRRHAYHPRARVGHAGRCSTRRRPHDSRRAGAGGRPERPPTRTKSAPCSTV